MSDILARNRRFYTDLEYITANLRDGRVLCAVAACVGRLGAASVLAFGRY